MTPCAGTDAHCPKIPFKGGFSGLQEYFLTTGRRVTFEYSLVKGVNDNRKEAAELAALLKGCQGHVNLIPVNPIKERNFVQSDRKAVEEFKNVLEKTESMLLLEERWEEILTEPADS